MGMKKLFVCSMIFFTSQMFDGLNQLNVRWFAKSAICSISLTLCLERKSREKDDNNQVTRSEPMHERENEVEWKSSG